MKRFGLIWMGLLLFAAAGLRDGFDRWVARTELPVVLYETSTEMRDRNGGLLRVYTVADGIWRLKPDLSAVDDRYLAMLVRYEDHRFYSHSGVDLIAVLRALGQAVRHGRIVSGGSTLTMQVARLLEDSGTGDWAGKLRQLRVALALERTLDKDQILSLYLTHAPFGGNLEGVRAATLAWFGKEPDRLTPAQAALLVALPQSPELRRPDRYPQRASAARNRVLDRLTAKGLLSRADAVTASDAPMPVQMKPFPRLAPHLTDRVLSGRPAATRQMLTLDARIQSRMEEIVARGAAQAGRRLSVAILVADHDSGEVLAAVGSPGYDGREGRQGFVDMTRARRSPGSTLKPLVYGLAFDQGLAHPQTMIHDGPVQFGTYAPQNFDGVFRGDVLVRDALQQSLNIPVVRLTAALGPARVMAALSRSGAQTDLNGQVPGLAVSLGGLGLNLWDLVQLYGLIAQGGQGPHLHATKQDEPGQSDRVLSRAAAWQVGDILAGISPPHNAVAPERTAYKTGTSYGHRDAWAVGYDGAHVIGVWIGRADGTPVPGIFGGELAAPMLFDAFAAVAPKRTPLAPPPPETLLVSTADLPVPLRVFRSRGAVAKRAADAPQLTFPPDGATIETGLDPLTLKLRGGVAPFSVLANGAPVLTGAHRRELSLNLAEKGFASIVVVDAQGRSDRVEVRLR